MSDRRSMTINPDCRTRESVMLAAGRGQFSVRDNDTGMTVYVKFECKRRKDTGDGYERGTVPLDEATHVFVSEKGYGTPRLGTYYPPREGYDTGRFFTDLMDADPHMRAIEEIVALVEDGDYRPTYSIEAENACGMCGHRLEDIKSIERGIGPECAGKPTGTKVLHAFENRPQLPLEQPEQTDLDYDNREEEAARAQVDERRMDETAQQVEVIREQIASLEGDRAEIDARIAALRGQEASLMDKVPF